MLSIRNTLLALLGVACVATADEATEKAWQALRRRVQETNSTIVGGDQQTEREGWMVRFADGSCGGSLISEDLGSSCLGIVGFTVFSDIALQFCYTKYLTSSIAPLESFDCGPLRRFRLSRFCFRW